MTMSEPRLTVVMPMKGRWLFTFRFLSYANELRLPYRFLIADGLVDEAVAQSLENSRVQFPNIDVEYIRYPNDTSFSRYFAKMSDAVQHVRTPYVMHADNDDFLGSHGIEKAIDFLEAHSDYVCARGHQVTFTVYSRVGGSPGSIAGRINQLYWDNDFLDVNASSAIERLRQAGLCHRMYYAVYRTDVLTTLWREIADIDFSDLMLHEDFFGLRVLTLGKAGINTGTVSYYSQAGTGISYQPLRDWASHLLHSTFTSDAHAAIERIAAAGRETGESAAISDYVHAVLADRFRHFLVGNYGAGTRIKRALREKWPRLALCLQTRPRFSAGREEASILSKLKAAGAGPEDLQCVRDELAQLKATLSPDALAKYAGAFLPMARDSTDAEWLSI
jgi:glycosyltransferase domain-containing protein